MANPTRSDRTKAALKLAGEACFRESGYQLATTAEIARRAGVAEGTVFLHFSNKLSLLTAVTRDFYDDLQADGEMAVSDTSLRPIERLRRLIKGWTSRMGTHWDLITVFIETSQSQPGTELAETVIQRNRRYTQLCSGLIDKLKLDGDLSFDIPTSLYRDMLFGVLEHTARGQQYAGKPIATEKVGQRAIDLLLGVAPSPRDAFSKRLDAIEDKLEALLRR